MKTQLKIKLTKPKDFVVYEEVIDPKEYEGSPEVGVRRSVKEAIMSRVDAYVFKNEKGSVGITIELTPFKE